MYRAVRSAQIEAQMDNNIKQTAKATGVFLKDIL